jgi:hypothetical protein
MKAGDSIRREVFYKIIIEYGVLLKLVRLVRILNEVCSKVWVGRHLCNIFSFKNGVKQGDASSQLLFSFTSEYAIRKFQTN